MSQIISGSTQPGTPENHFFGKSNSSYLNKITYWTNDNTFASLDGKKF